MLFEKMSQYKEAKKTLIDNYRDVRKSASILKKSPSFSDLTEGEIISGLSEINEGLGDTISNFLSGAFGGDISKLKTVLTQMKEQELKFNSEEYQIYEEFYRTLQDQKALEKDKNNPNYQELKKDIDSARNSLNVRMKELTKSHNQIFNALEERIKDLVKDSNRKKKYFNAQRASDVLETSNDRYDKIKAITSKSAARTADLENFFNVSVDDLEKQRREAEEKAREEERRLRAAGTPTRGGNSTIQTPEELLAYYKKEYKKILDTKGTKDQKIHSLKELEKTIYRALRDNTDTHTSTNPFGDFGETVTQELSDLSIQIRDTKEAIQNQPTASAPTGSTTSATGASGASGPKRRGRKS